MLTRLPIELLCHIYAYLPTPSVNQVALTCPSLYASALPSLYHTITLSFRSHIRQLEAGLERNGILLQVVQHSTKSLVLKCKSGQHRLIFDTRPLLDRLAIESITLTNFQTLPVSALTSLFSLLPQVTHVSFKYCDLVSGPISRSLDQFNHIKGLEFHWTNFPKEAIDQLLPQLPQLDQVRLDANHNRHYNANNLALTTLVRHCPWVTDLVIGLQQVEESSLVGCIQRYGRQLRRLSVRIHSAATLTAIIQYAPSILDLTVRFANNEGLVAVLMQCHRLERLQVTGPLPTIVRRILQPDKIGSIFVMDHHQLKQLRSLV